MKDTPWPFVFVCGLLLGLLIGKWDTVTGLWSHRQQLSGASKISEGLQDLGIGGSG